MIKMFFAPFCVVLLLLTAEVARAEQMPAHEVLTEINLARTEPKVYAGFLREFRRQFRGKNYSLSGSDIMVRTVEGVKAVDKAIRFLSRQKPLPPLEWSDGLAAAAADLVEIQSHSGSTGHGGKQERGMRTRIERHGRWQQVIGENIGYGPDDARFMVMHLIIDDGVPDRGHRKNIFNQAYTAAGAACGPHPLFRAMCVIDFAGGFDEEK
jgi:uncharacterized protein YkwD